MQKKVKLTYRRRPGANKKTYARYVGQRKRKINSKAFTKWAKTRARPWTVRGRGFWQDFGRGFTSVFKPFATLAGPVLDAFGMPEFGAPLSAVAGLM